MIAYILDKKNLKVKDHVIFEGYTFCRDIEYANKSSITAPREVNVKDDDIVVCKDGTKTAFTGICTTGSTNNRTDHYTITLKQAECLFDRRIFADGEELITSGIEAFIEKAIKDNWTDSGDALMDRAYIKPVVETETPVAASLSGIVTMENGAYNLKTFLGNVKERYGIFTEFVLEDTNPRIETGPKLRVRIYRDNAAAVPIDTDISDIADCEETYSVSVLARLRVRWKLPDVKDSKGNITSVGEIQYREYYLRADRSITESKNDPERIDGTTKSVYIETDTEEEMLEEVQHEFQSNRYAHKVAFTLRRDSELYKPESYYVGRKCTLETKTGIKTSIITAIEDAAGSAVQKITMGKLKVTLTERLREAYG